MKRVIKFRGIRLDNGKFVYGYLLQNKDGKAFIKDTDCHVNDGIIDLIPTRVDPDSAGQFTGLKDKNGVEIYEGDKFEDGTYVVFENGIFGTTYENNNEGVNRLSEKRCSHMTIIGSIH